MENNQLHEILKKLIGSRFVRVFSKGEKSNFKICHYYVYNTSTPPQDGHFLAIYISAQRVYVFDSLAVNKYEYFEQHFPCHTKFTYVNNKKIQSEFSVICALYVIYVIYNHSEGKTFEKILKIFGLNRDLNDSVLYSWYIHNSFFNKFKFLTFTDSKTIKTLVKDLCKSHYK